MGQVLSFVHKQGKNLSTEFNLQSQLSQMPFRPHEIRAIGEIQSCLVTIGFSRDPNISFSAHPDKDLANNKVTLSVDVAPADYRAIFGEFFDISITKFKTPNGTDFFKMETPLSKASGEFSEVITFVQNFINTNLNPKDQPVRTLVAS